MVNHLLANNHLGQSLIIVDCVGAVVSLGIVCLRVYAVSLRRRTYRAHDYFAFAALLVILGFCVTQIIGVAVGGDGLHTNYLRANDPDALVALLKTYLANLILWLVASVLIKLSILFLYLDLFSENRRFKVSCCMMIAVICVYFIASFCYFMLLCRPLTKAWFPEAIGSCASLVTEQLSTAILLMILDLGIIFLPMPIIWSLKMSFRKKMSVSLVFGLGLIVTVINALRIYYTTSFDTVDLTYSLISVGILAGLELFFGLIIACAPTLQPLLGKISQLGKRYQTSDFYKMSAYRTRSSIKDNSGVLIARDDRLDTKNFLRLDDGHANNLVSSWATHSRQENSKRSARRSHGLTMEDHGEEMNCIHVTQELDSFASRTDARAHSTIA